MNDATLIIFALFFILIGFVTALLIVRLWQPGAFTRPRLDVLPGLPDLESPAPAPEKHPGAIQVWQAPQNGGLRIEMDGQVVSSVFQLSAEQRRVLSSRSADLVSWLNLAEPEISPAPAPDLAPSSGSSPVLKPSLEPPPVEVDNRSALLRALQPSLAREQPKPTTLAGQVDEILQERLPLSPLAHRSIRLLDMPDHGLLVLVDQAQYDSIDSVPDADVRQFIKDAVAEWQRRAHSKL